MYEAPDRYKRLISARLPGGKSAGLAAHEDETESSPLRDVQLMSRAQLAPFFAAANIVAALMMVANLWDVIAVDLAAAVGRRRHPVNLVAMQLARTQAITCVGRSGRRVPHWLLVGDVALRALHLPQPPALLFSDARSRHARSSPPRSWPALASAASASSSSRNARWPG